jgi:hypothetical protein
MKLIIGTPLPIVQLPTLDFESWSPVYGASKPGNVSGQLLDVPRLRLGGKFPNFTTKAVPVRPAVDLVRRTMANLQGRLNDFNMDAIVMSACNADRSYR